MLRNILSNKQKVLTTIPLVFLLVAIRVFENVLFYDPFSNYFKSDYLNLSFPSFDGLKLFFAMSFRYFLNAIISLGIIHLLFSEKSLTQFASFLYLVFFVFLIVAFFSVVFYSDHGNNFILFYIRRFLIQPLFLLLFLPAFYYQQRSTKNNI